MCAIAAASLIGVHFYKGRRKSECDAWFALDWQKIRL